MQSIIDLLLQKPTPLCLVAAGVIAFFAERLRRCDSVARQARGESEALQRKTEALQRKTEMLREKTESLQRKAESLRDEIQARKDESAFLRQGLIAIKHAPKKRIRKAIDDLLSQSKGKK